MINPPSVVNARTVDESGSSRNVVTCTTHALTRSYKLLKSSIEFWISRMFIKKSRLSSGAGFAGCRGGDMAEVTSVGALDNVDGGGGCRASYPGTRRANTTMNRGSEIKSPGFKVTRENIVIAEIVSMGLRHVRTSSTLFCTRNITPTLWRKSKLQRDMVIPSRESAKVAGHQVEG